MVNFTAKFQRERGRQKWERGRKNRQFVANKKLYLRNGVTMCVPKWIKYKVAVLMYKVLQGSAPRYLGPLARVADQPGRQTLRSASSSSLLVPAVRLSTVGSRVFSVAGPRVWNTLPEETTSALSLTIFCRRLKTWLFRQSYPDLIIWPGICKVFNQ